MNARISTRSFQFFALFALFALTVTAEKGGKGKGGGNGGGDTPPPNPVIAYYDKADIEVMDVDGANRITLVPRRTTLFSNGSPGPTPAWSPDGTLVAYFAKDRSLTIVTLGGTVANQPAAWINWWDTYPVAWSESGLVYASQPDTATEPTDLFIVQVDGSGLLNLTATPDRYEFNPSWVPAAVAVDFTGYDSAIAFVDPEYQTGVVADNLLIAGVKADGTLDMANAYSVRDALAGTGMELPEDLSRVQWANTANRFLLTHGGTVWVYDLDAGIAYPVAAPPADGNFEEGSWSPDDSQLAITGKESKYGQQSIYIVPSDGTGTPVAIGSGRHPNWWRNAN